MFASVVQLKLRDVNVLKDMQRWPCFTQSLDLCDTEFQKVPDSFFSPLFQCVLINSENKCLIITVRCGYWIAKGERRRTERRFMK